MLGPLIGRVLRPAAFAAALALPLSSAAAQTDDIGSLLLTVVASDDSQPLQNVEIFLDGTRVALTDAGGGAVLTLPTDRGVAVEVRRIGYLSRSVEVGVPPGRSILLTVPMEIEPIVLAGVEASGSPTRRSARLEEFYRRVRTGAGDYITRAEIERRQPRNLSDLLRSLPGIRLTRTPGGDRPSLEARRSIGHDLVNPNAAPCAIQYFIDGSPIKPIHDGVLGAEIAIHEIEGIEVYRRGSTTSAEYLRMSGGCGVILIWKKDRE